jgi:hypothetical protein
MTIDERRDTVGAAYAVGRGTPNDATTGLAAAECSIREGADQVNQDAYARAASEYRRSAAKLA